MFIINSSLSAVLAILSIIPLVFPLPTSPQYVVKAPRSSPPNNVGSPMSSGPSQIKPLRSRSPIPPLPIQVLDDLKSTIEKTLPDIQVQAGGKQKRSNRYQRGLIGDLLGDVGDIVSDLTWGHRQYPIVVVNGVPSDHASVAVHVGAARPLDARQMDSHKSRPSEVRSPAKRDDTAIPSPTGVPGTVDIVGTVDETSTPTKFASMVLAPSKSADSNAAPFVLNASNTNSSTVYLIPQNASMLDGGFSSSEQPAALMFMVYDPAKLMLVPYCATFDPNPPTPAPIKVQNCSSVESAHSSKRFAYNPTTRVLRPVYMDNSTFTPVKRDDSNSSSSPSSAAPTKVALVFNPSTANVLPAPQQLMTTFLPGQNGDSTTNTTSSDNMATGLEGDDADADDAQGDSDASTTEEASVDASDSEMNDDSDSDNDAEPKDAFVQTDASSTMSNSAAMATSTTANSTMTTDASSTMSTFAAMATSTTANSTMSTGTSLPSLFINANSSSGSSSTSMVTSISTGPPSLNTALAAASSTTNETSTMATASFGSEAEATSSSNNVWPTTTTVAEFEWMYQTMM